jgi:hypothetical protein
MTTFSINFFAKIRPIYLSWYCSVVAAIFHSRILRTTVYWHVQKGRDFFINTMNNHRSLKSKWRVEVRLHAFLTYTLDDYERLVPCPSIFPTPKVTLLTIESRMVLPRADIDSYVKRKSRCSSQIFGKKICRLVNSLG